MIVDALLQLPKKGAHEIHKFIANFAQPANVTAHKHRPYLIQNGQTMFELCILNDELIQLWIVFWRRAILR